MMRWLVVLGVVVLMGCARSDRPADAPFAELVRDGGWSIVTVSDGNSAAGIPSTDPPVSVRFVAGEASGETGRVEGFAGVNRFNGAYRITEDGGLSIGPIAATKMAGPSVLMRFEAAFLRALEASRSIERDGNTWVLRNEDGVTVRIAPAR
ncbi:MAG: META domain-containing protein [Phycisphaeraceae bacterium]|nr:MAG: META domain-containing protein [Phycisphaeraceae bacterium]